MIIYMKNMDKLARVYQTLSQNNILVYIQDNLVCSKSLDLLEKKHLSRYIGFIYSKTSYSEVVEGLSEDGSSMITYSIVGLYKNGPDLRSYIMNTFKKYNLKVFSKPNDVGNLEYHMDLLISDYEFPSLIPTVRIEDNYTKLEEKLKKELEVENEVVEEVKEVEEVEEVEEVVEDEDEDEEDDEEEEEEEEEDDEEESEEEEEEKQPVPTPVVIAPPPPPTVSQERIEYLRYIEEQKLREERRREKQAEKERYRVEKQKRKEDKIQMEHIILEREKLLLVEKQKLNDEMHRYESYKKSVDEEKRKIEEESHRLQQMETQLNDKVQASAEIEAHFKSKWENEKVQLEADMRQKLEEEKRNYMENKRLELELEIRKQLEEQYQKRQEDEPEEVEAEAEAEPEEVEAEDEDEAEPEPEPEEPEAEDEPEPEPVKQKQVVLPPPPQDVEQVEVKYMQKTKPKLAKKIYTEEEMRKFTRDDLIAIAKDMNVSQFNGKYTSSAKYNILFAGILQIQNSHTKK